MLLGPEEKGEKGERERLRGEERERGVPHRKGLVTSIWGAVRGAGMRRETPGDRAPKSRDWSRQGCIRCVVGWVTPGFWAQL